MSRTATHPPVSWISAFGDTADKRLGDLLALCIPGRRNYARKHPPMLSDKVSNHG